MKKTLSLIAILILIISCKDDKYPSNFKEILPFGVKYHITNAQALLTIDTLREANIIVKDSDEIAFYYQLKPNDKNEILVSYYFINDSLYCIKVNNENKDFKNKASIKEKNKMAFEFFKNQKINLNAYGKTEEREDYYIFQMKNSLEKITLSLWSSLDNYVIMFEDKIITKRIDAIKDKRSKEKLEIERQKFDGTKRIIVENSVFDGSVRQVEKYLKASLKDPQSYESIDWNKVIETDNGYSVNHKYRAKNSLGGFVIENKVFYLDFKGNVIRVE